MIHDGLVWDRRHAERLTPSIHVSGEWDLDAGNYCRILNLPVRLGLEVNNLVHELKCSGLWPKIKSLFPFIGCDVVGGSGISTDLKTLKFVANGVFGGWTLSKTGAKPNGANAMILTGWGPNANLNPMNHHLAFYSRTQSTSIGYLMGVSTNFNIDPRLAINYVTGQNFRFNSHASTFSVSGPTTTGLIVVCRSANNIQKAYRNGIQIGSTDTQNNSGNYPTAQMAIGASNSGNNTGTSFGDKECSFASMGDTFTDAEVATFYEIVQRYQNRLCRAV